MDLECDAVQMRIKGLRTIDFFDDEFIGMLEKKFPNIKFQHFCMYLMDEEDKKTKERLAVAHSNISDEKKQIMNVDADKPDSLKKIMEVIEEYADKKGLI